MTGAISHQFLAPVVFALTSYSYLQNLATLPNRLTFSELSFKVAASGFHLTGASPTKYSQSACRPSTVLPRRFRTVWEKCGQTAGRENTLQVWSGRQISWRQIPSSCILPPLQPLPSIHEAAPLATRSTRWPCTLYPVTSTLHLPSSSPVDTSHSLSTYPAPRTLHLPGSSHVNTSHCLTTL